jgi:hypothetical protein
MTPGKAAHDTWCADDDWDELDDEARSLWEDAAQAGHAEILRRNSERVLILAERVAAGDEQAAREARELAAMAGGSGL